MDDQRQPPPSLTRRRFLGGAVTLVCATPVFGLGAACGDREDGDDEHGGDGGDAGGDARETTTVDGWIVPVGTKLSAERFAALCALMDALIPGDETSPGAVLARAPWYLDQLLGAFDAEPPRIFAGGPYSGRHGGDDDFSRFQPLTRVEELRWRTYLEGSRGLPEREWNGPVVGLLERYETGLDALEVAAQAAHGRRFALLSGDERRALLLAADTAFVDLAYGQAVEGTYGDPVYGGNFELSGWAAIGYEGDRQPEGYTAREMSHPEEG
ncbi:MAG: gluconate 2-dehydrogenase subunit 3 family protein [Deltaproteobacteria bacterium]|nr:gluconate 2-dehydrogenase subunit 3 family protein [Deltaproteobacteria bacterium]